MAVLSLTPLGCETSNGAGANDGGNDAAAPLRTLTPADVQPTPAGFARGMAMAGTYKAIETAIDGCVCRAGTCSSFPATLGALTTVAQQDGLVTIDGYCVGGVNADGDFSCGGQTSSGGTTTLAVHRGFFWGAAGVWVGFNLWKEMTVTGSIDGNAVDCDVLTYVRAEADPPRGGR